MIGQATYKEFDVIDPESLQNPAEWGPSGSILQAGAWRWPIVYSNSDKILPLIQDKHCIDFGGGAAPVAYGAQVVDRLTENKSLIDLPGQWDTIFTCHTLEHIVDISLCVQMIHAKLKPGGHIVAVVPSWQFTKLRAENWPHHAQTFYLWRDVDRTEPGWQPLDAGLATVGFTIDHAEDDGDCILVIGRKD